MDYNEPNIKRELIMSHYSKPKLKGTLERNDIDEFSNHCVDELHIQLDFDGDKLKTAKWDGIGCAVFQSSSDIFIGKLIGMTKKEMKELAINYDNLINKNGKEFNEDLLGELLIYRNVKDQLNRLNCADMVSKAIMKMK